MLRSTVCQRTRPALFFLLVLVLGGLGLALSGCGGSSKSPTVAVTATVTTVDATDALTLTATVTNDKNAAGVTWSMSGGGSLSNTSPTSATFTAPAATSSTQTVTITATSVADSTETGTLTLTIPAKLTVTTTGTQLTGAVGAAYSVQLATSTGIAPYTWSVSSGTPLPSGWTLTSGGLLTGPAPTNGFTGGTYTFDVQDSGTPTPMSASESLTITITPAPAIVFSGVMPATGTYNTAYTGSAAATGGVGTLTYSLASGALPGGLTLNSATGAVTGTPTATGSFSFGIQAADAFGDSAIQSDSVAVAAAMPTLAFAAIATHTYGDTAFTVSASSASSGAVTYSVTSGPATINSSTGVVTITGAGTVVLGATQAATADYKTATASITFTVNPETPTLTFAAIPAHTYGDAAFTASATSASSGAVTYSVTSGPATVNSSTGLVTITGGGSVTLGATQAASGNYASATASIPFTVNPATTTLAFAAIPAHTYGDAAFTATATSASSGAVTYSVTSGPATINSSTGMVTITGVGTVVLGATQAATADYAAPTAASTSFAVGQATPTLAFAAISTQTYGEAAFTATASSASSGAVTYSVTSGPATINSSTGMVTITGVGTVVLGATQAATADYTAPTAASTSFMVNQGTPTLTFAAISTKTYGDAAFTAVASSASIGAITYSVTSGPATINSATGLVTITGAGTVVLGATQAATTDYLAPAPASISFAVNGEAVTLTFATIPTKMVGDAAFTVSATSASSGAVTYSLTSGPATVNSATGLVTLSGTAGMVVLGASQTANGNYAAGTASTSFTVEAALAVTNATPLPTGVMTVNYSQQLTASGGSGTYSSWAVTGGNSQLAAVGLSLNTATGVLSGTTATLQSGSATFTVQVTDSQSNTASATLSVTINASLAISTTVLSPNYAYTGSSYSQTLAATGGSGSNSWSVTVNSSGLTALGLSLNSSTGVISGTSTSLAAGSATFTVQVKDSNNETATQSLSITVYSALTLNSTALPTTGYTGVNYSGQIAAYGGSGSYSYSVTGLTNNLTATPSGGGFFLTISGTPNTAETVTFSVKLTDTTTGVSITQTGLSIVFSTPTPVSLPTPNPGSLPAATQNQTYSGTIQASGGVYPYTWSVNGTSIPTTGSPVTISNGITVANDGSDLLVVTGTPTATGTVTLTNVKVTDSLSSTASNTYTIAVNSPGQNVSGQISLTNNCSGSNIPQMTLNLYTGSNTSGTPVQTVSSDNSDGNQTGNGTYTFSTVPAGSYTIVPSISGPSSAFYPASQAITVSSSDLSGENFQAALGYTVSGSVSYGGTQSGQVYLYLNNNCGSTLGTSIPEAQLTSGGAFTIHGLAPGNYAINAWMDPLGYGADNATDPSDTSSSGFNIYAANATGQSVPLSDPSAVSLTSVAGPQLQSISPLKNGSVGGVLVSYNPITNSNGVETPTSYTLEWSTSSSFTSVSSYSLPATGDNSNVWFVNDGTSGITGNFDSGPYYFRTRGVAGSTTSNWSSTVGPVTIAAPSGANSVSGTVTFTGTATGPLYVGFYDQDTGIFYGERIANPVSPQTYPAIQVPTGSNYFFVGIIDQNNNGFIDSGDINDINENPPPAVISGSTTTEDLTLSDAGSTASAATVYQSSTYWNGSQANTSTGYSLNLDLRGASELPVAVELTGGPNIVTPVDLGLCSDCGSHQFQYTPSIGTATPTIGDTYTFAVTYVGSSTPVNVTAQVTGWNGTTAIVGPSDLATGLSPSETTNASATPDFTWIYPANASSYTYQFWVSGNNNGNLWSIPGNNSNSNGFASSDIPVPAGIQWPNDPTDNSNTPSGSLVSGDYYTWQIQTQDSNNNQAQAQTYFLVP